MKIVHSRKSRSAAIAAATALVLVPLAACGGGDGSGDADGVVEIQFWDTQATPARTESLNEIIDLFEAQNPDIRVSYVGLPSDSYEQKVDTAIATGSTPDVITASITDSANWVAQGALAPLDDRFEEGGWPDLISASMVETARSVVPDHQLYFAPDTGLANTMWLNLGILEAEGVAVPTTWDEFYDAAEQLTHPERNQFGYIFRGGAGMFPQVLDAMYGQSGVSSFFDDDGNSTLNDPRNVAALERYVGLFGNQTASADLTNEYTNMVAQFASGSGVLMNHNIGSYQDHVEALGAENVLGLQPFPSAGGPVTVSGATVLGQAMFAESEHPDEAWRFIEFFLAPEGNAIWAEQSGKIPSNLEVAEQDWIVEAQPLQAAIAALNDPATQVLREPFYLPEYNAIAKTQLEPMWQAVLQGDMTVQEFLDTAAAAYTEAEASYRERVS
ncbi:ABC transporter substrate-binding protein [Occultella gossypii]|uniref:Sugar ABC transporter substrate-binding protein n=1 Tax=Occultella gossypii TaxID=2800820 RepID=A0ABS7S829_9MICO|nr:sugar ABC transporter substrate-binding protein [Occultella gossypii]MBZ2196400.1 sugar ABC transporter substrate-binding protein [Occultella gossypii]